MPILRPLKILVAEDNEDHANLIIDSIHKTDAAHLVAWAANGQEALTYLESVSHSEDEWPDIVMLDMKMPFLDGIETLTEIRRRESHFAVPVVIVSTSNSKQEVHAAFTSGANSYIVKPLQYAELAAKIKDFVHYWSQVTEIPGFRTH